MINFKESRCNLYTMDNISQPPIHCSKGNIKCVIKCTKFCGGKANVYMFKTKLSSIEHQYKKLGYGFNRKGRKNKYTCLMFDNKLLSSSKQLKLCPGDSIFPIKQEDICYYSSRCFMSSGLILDDIITNSVT